MNNTFTPPMTGSNCIVIGLRARSDYDDCIVFGTDGYSTKPRQLVIPDGQGGFHRMDLSDPEAVEALSGWIESLIHRPSLID